MQYGAHQCLQWQWCLPAAAAPGDWLYLAFGCGPVSGGRREQLNGMSWRSTAGCVQVLVLLQWLVSELSSAAAYTGKDLFLYACVSVWPACKASTLDIDMARCNKSVAV